MPFKKPWLLLIPLALFFILVSCLRPAPQASVWHPEAQSPTSQLQAPTQKAAYGRPTRDPNIPILTPTPDEVRILPTIQTENEEYTVQAGDQLGKIAQRYGVTLGNLIAANSIPNPDILEIGQVLTIPAPEILPPGSDFKIIPDSELVRGPASAGFDVQVYVEQQNGYLARYTEEVDDKTYTGAQVVNRVATEYSVNPRLLLALLEYQSGWVTEKNPDEETFDYPLRQPDSWRTGLYRQLAWAANNLNFGYYLWQLNLVSHYLLPDGSVIPPAVNLNAGTVGVQYLFSQLYDKDGWNKAISEKGLFATFDALFGYPFDYAVEPLMPADLKQPPMQLPFEDGQVWYFSGGPHGGWGEGSGWSALDFAPPGEPQGCVLSDAWVTAVADGIVTYSDVGTVLLDLDGDGNDQTGWSVLYLHIDSYERVKKGDQLKAGDRIGHPSCEGGVSNGTHVHMARRYNGVWISADRDIPFNLDGWVSEGSGSEYNGVLIRDGQVIEAWDRRKEENKIQR